MSQILEYAGYGVVFLLMISVLVAAHELGHYLFARLFNMGVEEFAIGFGKKPLVIWGRRTYVLPIREGEHFEQHDSPQGTAGFAASLEGSTPDRQIERITTPDGPALRETTNFTIRPWPLGGFVRIKGMVPEEDGSETKVTGGFYSKPPWQRFLVLLAGPLFSVLAGVLVLIPVLMIDGKRVTDKSAVIGDLTIQQPGYKAGLRPGDRVISIDGTRVSKFFDMVQIVRERGAKTLTFVVDRSGTQRSFRVTPYLDPVPRPLIGPDLEPTTEVKSTYKIGALPSEITEHLKFPDAVKEAFAMPIEAVAGLIKVFEQPSRFSDNVGGPATMVSATAAAVDHGIWRVLSLSALLSISVGIMNLLPTPPLDGGQMLMSVVEMFRRGRRLSIRAQAIAGGIGLTLVAALILGVFVVDFQRFATPHERIEFATDKNE